MKIKYTFLSFAIIFLFVWEASAKIWRVNNNQGVSADFTTLQAAHDRASSGDTLHIEGSANNYDADFICTKPLVIIGPGFFLGINGNLQANVYPAIVNLIRFNNGSSGSSVMGMTFNQVFVSTSNIVITRNKVNTILHLDMSTPASNILIHQNYLNALSQFNVQSLTGLLVANNVIEGYINMPNSFTGLFQNNIFMGNINVFNSNFTNNIMVGGTFATNNNSFSHNIGSSTQFGTANNNKSDVNMEDVFVGASGNSTDGRWKLKSNSPGKGAGLNGADAGIFGGANPYVLSGIPAVPTVYLYTVPPIGNDSNPLNVTIRVRSNN